MNFVNSRELIELGIYTAVVPQGRILKAGITRLMLCSFSDISVP
jgi:hypothetical protein